MEFDENRCPSHGIVTKTVHKTVSRECGEWEYGNVGSRGEGVGILGSVGV